MCIKTGTGRPSKRMCAGDWAAISNRCPAKYFYDSRGSALFDLITRLPEYYLTRVEQGLIAGHADEVMETVHPEEVIELGPGSPAKIKSLLSANGTASQLRRYVPFDVDGRVVEDAARALLATYPYLYAHGVVGDFETHLGHIPSAAGRPARRLLREHHRQPGARGAARPAGRDSGSNGVR